MGMILPLNTGPVRSGYSKVYKREMVSRRDFGKLALAAWPVSRALAAKINSDINGVRIGVQTYSFRSLPQDGIIDAVIHAMTEIGLGECELFGPQVEPNMMAALRGPGGGPGG